MKMLVMGMTLVSMLALVACNRSSEDSAGQGTGTQMEQSGQPSSGSDMGSGASEDTGQGSDMGSGASEPMGSEEATEGSGQQNP